ncbi:MAG: type II CRISPR-associated endonuclease Cas1 [Bacteroidetes bacterium]|nr:MAG: type II CRISPR-associated endonuclease Cas1 [Bacteroidota bacterium]
MLKRTLFFVNPYHLFVKNKQLYVKDKMIDKEQMVPAEDIGYVIFDNKQLTYTHSVMQLFSENNTAVIFCNDKHMPASMMINFESHHLHGQHSDYQIKASEPLKKNLWQQTIKSKIRNQASVLDYFNKKGEPLREISKHVTSGDSTNRESLAARIYWNSLFNNFIRHRDGKQPNSMLNFCYSILRSATAKAITGSGLIPVIGIHHKNKYNAYRLADDLMEPYRPFADRIVKETFAKFPDYKDLTKEIKFDLTDILTTDVQFKKVTRPLSVGLSMTTASLVKCYKGERKKISYPIFK